MAERRSKKDVKRTDPRSVSNFLEELSWVLKSYDNLDFRAVADMSKSVANSSIHNPSGLNGKSRKAQRANIFLVGVLPGLFTDAKLFPTNGDIVEFARDALHIEISRWDKISKHEIIGHIVCAADRLEERGLSNLNQALEKLQQMRSDKRTALVKQRNLGVSWNEIIQGMLDGST